MLKATTPTPALPRRVTCTFIMAKAKQKVTVPGMVGWTLLETAKHHGLLKSACHADSAWDYATFGEGPASSEDHVVVSREFFDKLAPAGYQEMNVLNAEASEHLTPTSRLATCITLTKELDGLTVIVPDTNPDLTDYC
jgi:ferredoxin